MHVNRLWIEIVALGTAIACVLALLIASVGAAAAAFAAQVQPSRTIETQHQVWEGMVTCSRCGAKHSPALAASATDCTRRCVHAGAAFALVDGDHSYILDGDLMLLKKIAGQRARIVGSIRGNTIKLISVADAT